MSWLSDLQQAVVDEVGAMSLTDVAVQTAWITEIHRDKLNRRELHVAPAQRKAKKGARGCGHRTATFTLLLVAPLTQGQHDAEIENSQQVVDEFDAWVGKRIGGFSVTEVEQPLVLDRDEFRENMFSTTLVISLEAISV